MTNDDLIAAISVELQSEYGCHTAILYGSRARGDWEATSDIDLIAFRDHGGTQRVASRWNGVFLDLFLHSTNDVPDHSWARLNEGRILFQRENFGNEVLAHVSDLLGRGPEPVSVADLHIRKVWAEKMLLRAAKGDIEGNYRRHWLAFVLLEDYFAARGKWYLGPKQSFRTLSESAPAHLDLFEAGFRPDAPLSALERVIDITFENVPQDSLPLRIEHD